MDCIGGISINSNLYNVKKDGSNLKQDKMLNNLFKKNQRKDKKGALTTQQIVLLIILIASFVVILYFFMKTDLGGQSEEQICYDSVVRASHKDIPGEVDLNCERTYICITADGTCEGMTKPDKREVENVEEIYSVLSQEMAECWWMFGAGKLDYVGKDAFRKNYCSICSHVLFDDSLRNLKGIKKGRLSKDKLYDYMSKHNTSVGEDQKKMTYAEYILGTNNVDRLKQQIASHENYTSDKGPSFGNITIGKSYYIVMGITSELSGLGWVVGGAGMAVVSFAAASNPLGWTVGAIVAGGVGGATGVAGSIIGGQQPEITAITVKGEGVDNQFMAPTIVEINSQKFEALNCKRQLTFA